jgi:hypothetical protein
MIRGGTEWRMEFRRDSRFGPLVETGISGVYPAILPDGVIRVAPFDEKEALCMIRESRGYPLLLEGWRRDPLDMVAFASALSAFSRLAFCEREVARLDVNPLFVNKKGVLVVDAFIERKEGKNEFPVLDSSGVPRRFLSHGLSCSPGISGGGYSDLRFRQCGCDQRGKAHGEKMGGCSHTFGYDQGVRRDFMRPGRRC